MRVGVSSASLRLSSESSPLRYSMISYMRVSPPREVSRKRSDIPSNLQRARRKLLRARDASVLPVLGARCRSVLPVSLSLSTEASRRSAKGSVRVSRHRSLASKCPCRKRLQRRQTVRSLRGQYGALTLARCSQRARWIPERTNGLPMQREKTEGVIV